MMQEDTSKICTMQVVKQNEVVLWMEQVRRLDYTVRNMIDRRNELRSLAEKITAGRIDGLPKGNSIGRDKVGDIVVKIDEMEKEIDKCAMQYIDYKSVVCAALVELPYSQHQALHLHYIDYKSWSDVASEMGYSYRQIQRIKIDGIKNLQKNIQSNRTCPIMS